MRAASIAVVAGETSGDIHAANLVAAISKLRPDVDFWGIGGERMERGGADIVYPTARIAAMGIFEAVGKLPDLARARKAMVKRFETDPPDLFIPVDFGGFNLRLAAHAKRLGIPVVYFIPPKAWAWGKKRIPRIRELVEELLVILPFEEKFWRDNSVKCTYVGSPIFDHLKERSREPEPDVIGLLPGSRTGEIVSIWPPMAAAARELARERPVRFLMARAPELPPEMPDMALCSDLDVEIIEGDSQQVMERARMCLVASGTATLECALIGTPLVSVYNVNPLTHFIGTRLVDVEWFSLPNLIAGRGVIPEILQGEGAKIAAIAAPLFDETPERSRMLEGLSQVRQLMGEPGASARAAEIVVKYLQPAP